MLRSYSDCVTAVQLCVFPYTNFYRPIVIQYSYNVVQGTGPIVVLATTTEAAAAVEGVVAVEAVTTAGDSRK